MACVPGKETLDFKVTLEKESGIEEGRHDVIYVHTHRERKRERETLRLLCLLCLSMLAIE